MAKKRNFDTLFKKFYNLVTLRYKELMIRPETNQFQTIEQYEKEKDEILHAREVIRRYKIRELLYDLTNEEFNILVTSYEKMDQRVIEFSSLIQCVNYLTEHFNAKIDNNTILEIINDKGSYECEMFCGTNSTEKLFCDTDKNDYIFELILKSNFKDILLNNFEESKCPRLFKKYLSTFS